MNAHSLSIGLSIALLAALSGSTRAAPDSILADQNINDQQPELELVHGCWGDEHGNLSGGQFFLPMDQEALEIVEAVKQANRGSIDNRVDLVIVGDGYQANEMGQFHNDADSIIASFFTYEPFKSYEPYFRFSQIEVISNESGVDNDTAQNVSRDTALDMSYWCNGTERLLCVNVGKAFTAASAAPDIDQIIAISNSSKYGGAGYSSNNLGTAAGQNSAAAEIAIHEMGHSLGDLADEYTYGGPTTYTGGELTPVDVSIYDQAEQISRGTKWYRWMDASMTGFDNPVRTYEGGNYSVNGVFRPSPNSMMRSLGRNFNLVSAEKLLKEIYREVNPIDDGTPNGTVVNHDDSLWVTPMQPLNHDLQVLWYLDDALIVTAVNQHTLNLDSLIPMDGQFHTVRVDVVDPTPWVINEVVRNNFLSESRTYGVNACSLTADLSDDGSLNFFDVSAFLSAYNAQDPSADFTGDGSFNFFDVSAFLVAFNSSECQ